MTTHKILCILSLALSFSVTQAYADSEKEIVLANFENEDSADGWTTVNDDVMGGVSKGGFRRTDEGKLLFKGDLSLENNGGFSSIRSKSEPIELSGTKALVVRAKGDGRTYWVELRVTDQMRASSYRADLPTTDGEWKDIVIPIEDFQLQAFGRTISTKPIDLEEVESVGFTLADKKAGKFQMEVESIKAVKNVSQNKERKGDGTIVDVADAAGQFKTLLAAATAADLAGALSGDGPLTVFAPTDEAFSKVPKETLAQLLKPENKDKLAAVLKYHVIAGKVSLADALAAGEGKTLQGAKVKAKFENGSVRINSAKLLSADIPASNGIIHVIDSVLLPPESETKPLNAMGLIELAVRRGVPMFNDGDEAGCAAVYEIACESIRARPEVSKKSREILDKALTEMREQSSSRRKAWILRDAMDTVYLDLSRDQVN